MCNLMIVARDEAELYDYLKRDFADEPPVQVVMDRRHGERRQVSVPSTDERRRSDRRTRKDVQTRLAELGYVFVRCDCRSAEKDR